MDLFLYFYTFIGECYVEDGDFQCLLFNFTYISIKRGLLKWFFSIHFVSKILISKVFSIFRKKHENLMNAFDSSNERC